MAQTRFHLPTTMERVNNHKTIWLKLLKEMEKMISTSTVNMIVSSTTERRLDFTIPLIELCTFTFTYSMDPFPAMFTHIHLSPFINLGKWIPHIFFLESTSILFFCPLGSKISKYFSICCIDWIPFIPSTSTWSLVALFYFLSNPTLFSKKIQKELVSSNACISV